MKRAYKACLEPVPARGVAPVEFLDTIMDVLSVLPDAVFLENDKDDIYDAMRGALGPYMGLKHRIAVMCEVARVTAAQESGWDWKCGVDTTNKSSMANISGQEAGAFQVSANSMGFDASLTECVRKAVNGKPGYIIPAQVFIASMKTNHDLAVEYFARLVRFDIRWDGPIASGVVAKHASRAAVAEFQSFL